LTKGKRIRRKSKRGKVFVNEPEESQKEGPDPGL